MELDKLGIGLEEIREIEISWLDPIGYEIIVEDNWRFKIYDTFQEAVELVRGLPAVKELKLLRFVGIIDFFFPDFVKKIRDLEVLNISMCRITSIPEYYARLTGLTKIFLFKNRLPTVPEFIRACRKLVFLDIRGNLFTKLPHWIGELKELRELRIGSNELQNLPDSVMDLPHLEILDIRNAKFEPPFDFFKRLAKERPALDIKTHFDI